MPTEPGRCEFTSIGELHAALQDCTRCSSLQGTGYWKFPVDAHGNPESKVWIVGLNPRKIDTALRAGQSPRYWTGRSRSNLRDPIEERFGRPLEELVYLTDVIKCQGDGRALRDPLRICPNLWLRCELVLLRPSAILTLGREAERALDNVETLLAETEVVNLLHPSPINGPAVRMSYGSRMWSGYHDELISALERWLS